jgi:predicted dehydrogenase
MDKIKVGVIGCGAISPAYFTRLPQFGILEVKACADLIWERTQARAQEFKVPMPCSVAELLADPEIRIVVNLTTPQAHHSVAKASLEAGKNVYGEKPFTVLRDEGKELLALAAAKGLLACGAPDTFLGGGIQTCRKLIDDGWIGEPIACEAFMLCRGHESWHPDPEFYYQVGGGPMFDMGPYYLTALVNLLGPVKRVTGSARISFPERLITSAKKYGQRVTVEVPTHVTGTMEFRNGAIGTIITSFDTWGHTLPHLEIHGSLGSLQVPNPNTFGGPVKIRLGHDPEKQWRDIPLSHVYSDNWRGVGVADLAYAIASGRPPRASGELAYHVLDLMHAFHDAAASGRHVKLQSTCPRPAMLPLGLREGELDC